MRGDWLIVPFGGDEDEDEEEEEEEGKKKKKKKKKKRKIFIMNCLKVSWLYFVQGNSC